MQAIYLVNYGDSESAFEIREVPTPKPSAHEVLVEVKASGINFADIVARRGLYPDAPDNPTVLGYDISGHVAQVGSDVKNFAVGDQVFGMTRFGGYASHALVDYRALAHVPDNIDILEAPALATQACTAYYNTMECINSHADEVALVHAAAGGVGSMMVQMLVQRGVHVIATASAHKHNFVKALGAKHIIDYRNKDFFEIVKDKYPDGIDYVFDSIGGKSFRQGMKLLKPGGAMVSFGVSAQINGSHTSKIKALGSVINFGIYSPVMLLMKSLRLNTVNMLRIADYRPELIQHILNQVSNMAQEGILTPTLDSQYEYKEIAQAHDRLESRKSVGKVVITW